MSKEPRQVMLRDEHSGADSRYLWAYLDVEGNLHIDGQDLGPSTGPVSGDGEYEWFSTISVEDVPRLLTLLGSSSEADVLSLLEERWSGSNAGELESIIQGSDIEVKYHAWSG